MTNRTHTKNIPTREQFHTTYGGLIKQTDFATGYHTYMSFVANAISRDAVFDNYCKLSRTRKDDSK